MVKETHRGVKTTVELPKDLWRAAKLRALDDGSDMRAVIVEALEKLLGVKSKKGKKDAR